MPGWQRAAGIRSPGKKCGVAAFNIYGKGKALSGANSSIRPETNLALAIGPVSEEDSKTQNGYEEPNLF